MAVWKRSDIERVDVLQQLIKAWVGTCFVLSSELPGLDLSSRPDAGQFSVWHKAQTLGESMSNMACAYDPPTD